MAVLPELHEQLGLIENREDLVNFIDSLVKNLDGNPEEWANIDLASFLQAMTAWVGSMEFAYKNNGQELPSAPTWDMFARILYASKIYE